VQIKKRYNNNDKVTKRIGVHCLAGLGRAPFFVALAFVNNGCDPQNAIDLVRKHRPGAFNLAQAYFILEFKAKQKDQNN
jgi:protein tyrosine phosphatase type IVA